MNDASQDELSKRILSTTVKIQNEFPELIKYLNEIPVYRESLADKCINIEALQDYLDSLHRLLETYKKEHTKNI